MGDLLVIHDTGAHGYSMGCNYNGRLRSAEVLLRPDGSADLIRRAERPVDYFCHARRAAVRPESCWPSRAPKSARHRAQDERLAVAASVEQTHPDRGSEGEEHGHPQSRGFNRRPLSRRLKRTAVSTLTRSERLIDFHLQNGTDAILTLGTTGERPR